MSMGEDQIVDVWITQDDFGCVIVHHPHGMRVADEGEQETLLRPLAGPGSTTAGPIADQHQWSGND